ncbi:hypothetical protein B0H19DRAFT_1075599 [Mycena capillaripes]|nr:hypothetical protein B0H19DRAFT_1075599 [Mycena capillaripes]
MDDEPQLEREFTAEASSDDHGPLPHAFTSTFFSKSKDFGISGGIFTNFNEATPSQPFESPSLDQYTTSAFFSNSKHIVVMGGTFTNNNHVAPSNPPDFRVIPIGDLNLLKEIKHPSESLVVRRWKGRASTKRMYTARIPGFQSAMTAAVFQGEGAEKQWHAEISRYSDIRCFPRVKALPKKRYTGSDLIPHTKILEKYRGAHFSTVFFWACIDVNHYMSSMSGRYLHYAEYMVWIRPSTTQLCIELMAPAHDYLGLASIESGIRPSDIYFPQAPDDSHIIASISLQAYHSICDFHLAWWHQFPISTNVSVQLGSIRHFTGLEYESSFEIAFAPECVVDDRGWSTEDAIIENYWNQLNGDEEGTSILENSWIRVNSANVVDEYRRHVYADDLSRLAWLTQANHIFNSLGIQSNLDYYVMVYGVRCHLWLRGPIDNLPPGFLFLCPLTEFQSEHLGHFQLPACGAHWSRDSSGAERLTAEEARNEGFPDIEFRVWARGRSWDDSVYTGIHQFHEAEGFDPYSQEVATELGYLQVSCEPDDLFDHCEPGISIVVDASDELIVQESDIEDDYFESDEDDDFSDSEDEESDPDALQDTALAGDTGVNIYGHEDFPSNLHQTNERYVDASVTPSSTISFGRAPTGCDPPLASLQLTNDRQKRPHPTALQSDGQCTSSKRAPVLSPGSLLHKAPNFSRDSLASFASSSCPTLDELRSSNNDLLPTSPYSPLGGLEDQADPLRDLDAAEVDAVMILSLGARS